MKHEEVVILCYRTSNPDVLVVDGASQTKCEVCGNGVWIAPSSRQVRQQMKAKVVCEVCGKKMMLAQARSVEIAPMSREQAEEIVDTMENRKRRN